MGFGSRYPSSGAAGCDDISLHVPRAADQALDRIGRRERLTEAIGEAECEDGERLFESFADAGRGTRVTVLQAPSQILQQASRSRDVRLLIRAHDDRADPRALTFRQMLQDVPEFVDVTPVNQCRLTKRLRHRFVQRFRAIEDDQETAIGAEAAALEIG